MSVFMRSGIMNNKPPQMVPVDCRLIGDVLAAPSLAMVPPDLAPKGVSAPVVPGNGNVTMGLGPIAYDHQPKWDRGDTGLAGPVRAFFRKIMYDNRIKHV